MTGAWNSGWATGDLTLAAQYAKGWGSIADTTLGGSAANVDMTSISGTYAHLLVIVYARGDTALASTFLNMRFNGDAAANYDWQDLRAITTTVSAGEAFAQAQVVMGQIPANTAGANLFSAQCIFIPHYAGSANNKIAVSMSAAKTGTTSGSLINEAYGGFWRSSAAINRITLLPNAGNFVSGTRVTLYAMGA